MSVADRHHESRRRAERAARELLHLPEPAVLDQDALFVRAGAVLGPERGARCLELARHARLSRRWLAMDAVAQLVVGTETLGLEWWSRPHFVMADFDDWEDRGAPDGLLAAGQDPGDDWCGSCLGTLGSWISEDAADAQWGRPVDWADLNRPDVNDRVHLPAGVSSGDRLVVAYDPGGRVGRRLSTGATRHTSTTLVRATARDGLARAWTWTAAATVTPLTWVGPGEWPPTPHP